MTVQPERLKAGGFPRERYLARTFFKTFSGSE